jgi:sirohydrochlorin ferrochelatase
MKVVLVDNGSLEPSAHAGLRAAAAAIGARSDVHVEAVSWKHSDRIPARSLEGDPARTLAPWIRTQVSAGEREFLFIPFFISPQGAIGSALRSDLVQLQAQASGFDFGFTDGLGDGVLSEIVGDRIRESVATLGLARPTIVVVDHGGPSPASADIRNYVAKRVRQDLGSMVAAVVAASMESPAGPAFEFNLPLLADVLAGLDAADVLIAPLFLLPGRHAGPDGDLARIARQAQGVRRHFTELVGSHPLAIESLADAVTRALASVSLS